MRMPSKHMLSARKQSDLSLFAPELVHVKTIKHGIDDTYEWLIEILIKVIESEGRAARDRTSYPRQTNKYTEYGVSSSVSAQSLKLSNAGPGP